MRSIQLFFVLIWGGGTTHVFTANLGLVYTQIFVTCASSITTWEIEALMEVEF